jgi:hypothetical protein
MIILNALNKKDAEERRTTSSSHLFIVSYIHQSSSQVRRNIYPQVAKLAAGHTGILAG